MGLIETVLGPKVLAPIFLIVVAVALIIKMPAEYKTALICAVKGFAGFVKRLFAGKGSSR